MRAILRKKKLFVLNWCAANEHRETLKLNPHLLCLGLENELLRLRFIYNTLYNGVGLFRVDIYIILY